MISMDTPTQTYDSRPDTMTHIFRVRELLARCSDNIEQRGLVHDASKLEEPEKSTFDKCTLKLKAMAYGSDEYNAALAELKPALAHHYAANSHHPEHFTLFQCVICKSILREDETWRPNINDNPPRLCGKCCPNSPIYECEAVPYVGVEGMSLFDVLEMFMDWKAATERMQGGGDIWRSIEINAERFKLSPQLVSILKNTAREMEWPKKQ